MEAVAQSDDATRRIMRDEARKPRQRRSGVIRRQQHAARGKARAFFQMQIGNDEQTQFRPIQHAFRIGEERSGIDRDDMVSVFPGGAIGAGMGGKSGHVIASLINSSAASASKVSDASP